MGNRSVEVQLCANEMDLRINMETFNQRLELQKRFYLLQTFGVDLGLKFSWYLRGPYCPELTQIGFDIVNEGVNITEFALRDSAKDRINRYQKWLQSSLPKDNDLLSWMELLASVHYIVHYDYLKNKSKETVCKELVERKNWYTISEAEYAWDVLDNEGLISNEKLI